MASSKKSKEEEKKKKSTKETKNTKTKPKKPKTNSKETVKNGEIEVLIIPSSSCDSQDIQDENTKKRSQITNQRPEKRAKPKNKSKRKAKEEEEKEAKICVFPMNRIKRIIQSQASDSSHSSRDLVFLINKASEMFIEQFCEEAYECSVQDRKKSLRYKHLSSVVSKQRRYDFLSDFVPEKLKVEDALAEWKSAETGAA